MRVLRSRRSSAGGEVTKFNSEKSLIGSINQALLPYASEVKNSWKDAGVVFQALAGLPARRLFSPHRLRTNVRS
jgi:hypothetical protein